MTDTTTDAPTDAILPPAARQVVPFFMQMALGQLLKSAVELRLPTEIGDEPVAVGDLADRVGADASALARLLEALSSFGFFRRVDGDRYAHTPRSAPLAQDAGGTLAELFTADWMWQTWDELTTAVRTGTSPFAHRHGKDFFGYLTQDNPGAAGLFNKAMTLLTGSANEAESLDLSTTDTVVDVGGGQGVLLRDLLVRHPRLRGVLFDIEPVIARALPELRQEPLADRCSVIAGSAFGSVPEGADAYVLRNVLHMWNDEDCARALENVVRVAAPGARVLVIELVLPERPDHPFPPLLDLQMLLLLGGRERSEAKFAELFERAGLKYAGITRTSTMFDVVEARVP
ncbi:methyltransferase [Actinophytocola sp.]|uniref:methyltransferase n=1 Tax=Actinophytocola sp. TaxID=1872138 RepID=UPI003D6C070D